MKIGTSRVEHKVFLFWDDANEETLVRAFARKHHLVVTIRHGKGCVALDVPGQRLLLHEFVFSTTTEAIALAVFDDIVRRMDGEGRPERSYGRLN